jgi:small nuclear ribonucleoprotein (snRNP)-like protein
MTQHEVSPYIDKCVAVYLKSGEVFQGFLRTADAAYEVDAGNSRTSIDNPEAIEHIDFLKA